MIPADLIEQAAIDTLRDRLPRHLAELERALNLSARTIQPPHIDLLDVEIDPADAVLIGIDDTATIERHADQDAEHIGVTWRLLIETVTLGGGRNPRADCKRRARWHLTAAVNCLLRDLVLDDRVEAVDLSAMRWDADNDDQLGAVGQGEAELDVRVPLTFTVARHVGQTEGLDPYDPPTEWPAPSAYDITVTRTPLEP